MITIVLGGQYGSEGKGSVVSWMAKHKPFDLSIRTGGSNAGHSFIDHSGKLHKMRQIPCSWDAQPNTPVYIPAGAVIKPEIFFEELKTVREAGYGSMVYVSPFASVITEAAEEREQALMSGSTKEGVGATRALKCVRQAPLIGDTQDPRFNLHSQRALGFEVVEDGQVDGVLQRNDKRILIEATQGFGLSLNYKFYPFCTSTDLTPYQLLQDAEMPFGVHNVEVWMVIRTFPIRIAGNSGYLYNELSWDILQNRYGSHIPVEQTTVTKKTRRVGEFDVGLVKDAIRQCRPNRIVLTFFDYLFPTTTDPISKDQDRWLNSLESKIGAKISHLGVGIGKIIERNGKAAR